MKHLITFVVAFVFSSVSCAIPDQPGTLDTTFNFSGKALWPVGSDADNARVVLVQPDGKIVIVGHCGNGGRRVMCALRLSDTGTPDPSFGTFGKFFSAPGAAGSDFAVAAALQRDGKLVLAGSCSDGITVQSCAIRIDGDGAPDPTFGVGGKLRTQVGPGFSSANAIAIQLDGKIVLAGTCVGSFCASRHHPDGGLDTTFNGIGSVVTSPSAGTAFARTIALQAGGKIVIVGDCPTAICALRYTSDGVLDTTANLNGVVVTAIGTFPNNNAFGHGVVAQPDGKLIIAGFCGASGAYAFCAVRYLANGTLDPTFGAAGILKTTSTFGRDAQANALLLQPDGRVVIVGTCFTGVKYDVCVARYNTEGVLDVTLNATGKVITALGSGTGAAYAIAQQPDGKLVVAGSCDGASDLDFCAARYDNGPFSYKSCSLDIDGDGRVLATTDSLIHARIALGMTGDAVVNGIVFPASARRTTWPQISDYLLTQCGQ